MSRYVMHFEITLDTVAHATVLKDTLLSMFGKNVSFSDAGAYVTEDVSEMPVVFGVFRYDDPTVGTTLQQWVLSRRVIPPVATQILSIRLMWHRDAEVGTLHAPFTDSEYHEVVI